MTEANSKNPENKLFKINRSPNGNWSVWKWEQDNWTRNVDWYLDARFKWRWQARNYVRQYFKRQNQVEYWPK